jgi:hypothetical protein
MVADWCPTCRGVQAFNVTNYFRVGHIYYISLGRGSLVATVRECSECGAQYRCEEDDYDQFFPEETVEQMSMSKLVRLSNRYLERRLQAQRRTRPNPGNSSAEVWDALPADDDARFSLGREDDRLQTTPPSGSRTAAPKSSALLWILIVLGLGLGFVVLLPLGGIVAFLYLRSTPKTTTVASAPRGSPRNAAPAALPTPEPAKTTPRATIQKSPLSKKAPGLLAYWSFDEGEGVRAADASGNQLHATLVNASWTDGIRGKALRLSGQGSYLDYGDSPRLSFAARAPFTIAFWTRTSRARGTLLSQRNSRDGGAVIDVLLADGRAKAQVRQDGNDIFGPTEVSSGIINDGKWHHLALTREGDSIELFLDGISQGKKNGNSSGGTITTDLRALGAERFWINHRTFAFGDPHFEGDMDEFCIFDHVLRTGEVAALAKR